MTIMLPESFVDVSTMREIPDTQECWADAGEWESERAWARTRAIVAEREKGGAREGAREHTRERKSR